MASNPMQRQKRVSFLLGMLVMLIIAAIVIALLFMQLINLKKEQDAMKAAERTVYLVTEDVASGSGIQITTIEGDTSRSPNVTQDVADSSVVPENIATASDFYSDEGQSQPRSDLVAKIDLKAGTILTKDMLTVSSETLTDDLRVQEYNMFSLPVDLEAGDYIDLRMRMTNGQDFIIAAKKEVAIPEIAGAPAEGTITVNLSEEETLAVSCAIVEAYQSNGIELYVSRYTDPGMQAAATPTYTGNAAVRELINQDPNIVEEAKRALVERYNNSGNIAIRENYINAELNSIEADDRRSNLEENVEEHIEAQKELRQQYLQALEDAAVVAESAASSSSSDSSSTNTTAN